MSSRSALPLTSLLLFLALLLAVWLQDRQPRPVALIPTLTGKEEYCLTCHADLTEISPSHPVKTFGCVICHGGERLALNADLAHSTLRGGNNPSDLSVVEASCGGADCHSGAADQYQDHIQRVESSLQATYVGAIASIRYTFGAQPDLKAHLAVSRFPGLEQFDPASESSPSIQAFGKNCLNCHLSAQPLPGTEYSRLTGCAACHTPTAGINLQASGRTQIHRLTTAIPYSQCNTCHNRGNYDLATMQFQPRPDQPTDRLHDYYQPIAQFTRCEWTLDCIDCHTREEAMGDGQLYNNKKEAQNIQCRTCHGTSTELPKTHTITSPDDLVLRLAFLNPVIDLKVGDTILVTDRGEPLWNTRQLSDGTYELFDKATGQRFTFRPVKGTACQQNQDEQGSQACHVCHEQKR